VAQAIRATHQLETTRGDQVRWSSLSAEVKALFWQRFNDSIAAIADANKLGTARAVGTRRAVDAR